MNKSLKLIHVSTVSLGNSHCLEVRSIHLPARGQHIHVHEDYETHVQPIKGTLV